MTISQRLPKIATTIFSTLLVIALSATPVSGASSIYDDFNSLPLYPSTDAKWHVINWGDSEPYRFVDYCGTTTCVEPKSQDGVTYVELSHTPGTQDGYFTSGEVSELETGFAYGLTTQWTPTFDHPTVMEFRARWSENYAVDGSGGAMGSNGVWMWNSPVDIPNETGHPETAFGFSWAPNTSPYGSGLNFIAINQGSPVVVQSIRNVDMQQWNDFKVVWETNVAGLQFIKGYVNGRLVGVRPLLTPMDKLSLTVWHDNSTLDSSGAVYYPAIQQNQAFDLDYLSLTQL